MSDTSNTTDLNTFLQQQQTADAGDAILPRETTVLKDAGIEMLDLDAMANESSPVTNSYTAEQNTKALFGEPQVQAQPQPQPQVPVQAPQPVRPVAPVSHLSQKPTESAEDLRNAFTNTLARSTSHDSLSNGGIEAEKSELLVLLDKIRDRLTTKKIHIKERLDVLKKDKEEIALLIEDVKELEETESKISAKLQTLSLLEQEIDSLQDEAREELL